VAVFTAHGGTNADLIAQAANLYIKDGAVVADVTYGLGAFWRKTDTNRFVLKATDLLTCKGKERQDFRRLPYGDGSIDVVVLDPPYAHNPGMHMTDKRYNNRATSRGMYHRDIIEEFYHKGIIEAARVLKVAGQLWIKCKDEVESGVQRWSHIEIYSLALSEGFFARDLFILVPTSKTSARRWTKQYHARKNHSYLWIMEKPTGGMVKQLKRAGVVV
jgi:hypothetical protein